MEAVPRMPMLSFEMKLNPQKNSQFTPELMSYIREYYQEDPTNYSTEIQEFEKLRSQAIRPTKDVEGCEILQRYYCQLCFLQKRFPALKEGPRSTSDVTWKDLWNSSSQKPFDFRVEYAVVLYNIGALHTQLGAADDRTTEEGLKLACTHFQCAAWAFQHLQETSMNSIEDFDPSFYNFLVPTCLAQAQECIVEKSMMDNRKPSLTAKLAVQICSYYSLALDALTRGRKEELPIFYVNTKNAHVWVNYVTHKRAYYECIMFLFLGMQAEEEEKMGHRVTYYDNASKRLISAMSFPKYADPPGLHKGFEDALMFTRDVVEGKKKIAISENDFIYHEPVPSIDTLPSVKSASLVKPIPINCADSDVSGQDIFSKLIPMKIHKISSIYSEEKAKLLRNITSKIEDKDKKLNSVMDSLSFEFLPTSSEDLNTLPDELVEKCAACNVKPDLIPNLTNAMNTLADEHHDVDTMMMEIKELIEKETAAEKEYVKLVDTSRPPSIVATDLTCEANKYSEALKKASESNETLHKAISSHINNLKILSLPLDELRSQLPRVTISYSAEEQAIMKQLETLVQKVEEMRSQRVNLLNKLRKSIQEEDISVQLLHGSGSETDDVIKKSLSKHEDTVKILEQNLNAQENIIKALTDTYASYGPIKRALNEMQRKRSIVINTLIGSYDEYEDVLSKTNKGIEFYKKLKMNVKKLLQRVKGTCKVQEEERQQIYAKTNRVSQDTESSVHPKLKHFLSRDAKPVAKPDTFSSQCVPAAKSADVVSSYYAGITRPPPVGSEMTKIVPSAPEPVANPIGPTYALPGTQPYNQSLHYGTRTPSRYSQHYGNVYGGQMGQPFVHMPQSGLTGPQTPVQIASQYIPGAQLAHHPQPGLQNVSQQPQYIPNAPPAPENIKNAQPVLQNASLPQSMSQPVQQYVPSVPQNVQTPSAPQNVPGVLSLQQNVTNVAPLSQNIPSAPSTPQNMFPTQQNSFQLTKQPPYAYTATQVSSQSSPTKQVNTAYQQNVYPQYKAPPNLPTPAAPYNQTSFQSPTPGTAYSQLRFPSTIPSAYNTAPHPGTLNSNSYTVPPPVQQIPSTSSSQAQNYSSPTVSCGYTRPAQGYQTHGRSFSAPIPNFHATNIATPPQQPSPYYHPYSPGMGDPTGKASVGYYTNAQHDQLKMSQGQGDSSDISQQSAPKGEQNGLYHTPQYGAHHTQVTVNGSGGPSAEMTYMQAGKGEMTSVSSSTEKSKSITAATVKQDNNKCTEEKKQDSYVDLLADLDFTVSDPVLPTTPVVSSIQSVIEKSIEKLNDLKIDESPSVATRPTEKRSADTPTLQESRKVISTINPFLDEELVNNFVNNAEKFEKFVERLTVKTLNGPTPIDTIWNEFDEQQEKYFSSESCSVGVSNPERNRNPEILPYNRSRVKLLDYENDYINASCIKTADSVVPDYIVTQSPLSSTYESFWSMIWDQNVMLIICLATDEEIGSDVYWPKEKNHKMDVGKLTIALHSINTQTSWIERIISVTKSGSTRVITHVQFTDWTDESMSPRSTLADFVTECMSLYHAQRNLEYPIVVHCLVGSGKSGIFIVLLALACRINARADIPDLVKLLTLYSENRRYLIKCKEQLLVTYQSALCYIRSILIKCGKRQAPIEQRKDSTSSMADSSTMVEYCSKEVNADLLPKPVTPQEVKKHDRLLSKEENKRRNMERFSMAGNLESIVANIGTTDDPLSSIDPLWPIKKGDHT